MPRPYHSPSSIELGLRCEHAWALRYIDGISDPGTAATEFGTALHSVGEAWYAGAEPDWRTPHGALFLAGLPHLPHRTRMVCPPLVERALGTEAIQYATPPRDGAPERGFRFEGILWVGYVDLTAWPTVAERTRLALPETPGPIIVDYKTSANIERYAKTPADLAADLQCQLYGLEACVEYDAPVVSARWVYFEKPTKTAAPRDCTVERTRAEDLVGARADTARHLDLLQTSADAAKNPRACRDFGGCKYHVNKGGPCDPSARTLPVFTGFKKDTNMALSFAERAAAARAAKATAAPETAPAEVMTEGAEVAESAVATADPTPPTEHPSPAKAPTTTRATASAEGKAGKVLEKLNKAKERREKLRADLAGVDEAINALLAEFAAEFA